MYTKVDSGYVVEFKKSSKNSYLVNYNKTHTKLVTLRLNLDKDKDIIDFLDSVGNVNGLLKDLLRLCISSDIDFPD